MSIYFYTYTYTDIYNLDLLTSGRVVSATQVESSYFYSWKKVEKGIYRPSNQVEKYRKLAHMF